MSFVTPFVPRSWMLLLAAAAGLLCWSQARHIGRLEHVAEVSRGDSVPDRSSPTGYQGGVRDWVLPDRSGDSYEWLALTQRALATGEWRIRERADENAPQGRAVHAASPYRWWLAFVARVIAAREMVPVGIAVERAALFADPMLQLALLVAFAAYVARRLGAWAATGTILGLATLFPLAAGFSPGTPDDFGLQVLTFLGAVLPLVVAATRTEPGMPLTADVVLAGCFGGLSLWISPVSGVPLLIGVFSGAALAIALGRRRDGAAPAPDFPWRLWGLAGAITSFAAYLFEYAPHQLGDWEIRAVHPLYSLFWLGSGELLALFTEWRRGQRQLRTPSSWLRLLLAAVAVAAIPGAMARWHNPAFLLTDVASFRLTKAPGGAIAPHSLEWLREEGVSWVSVLTLAPFLVVLPVAFRVLARERRAAVAMALGPLVVALFFACFQLHWWSFADAALVGVLAALFAAVPVRPRSPLLLAGALAAVGVASAVHLFPRQEAIASNTLSMAQGQGILERDLAHWLARRARPGSRPLVHATPGVSTALNYYGGLRGLGSRSWESGDGIALSIRVAISISREETLTLLRGRGVTHLVVAAYDPYFDTHTRASSMQKGELFYDGLRRWSLPTWLRPMPYLSPAIPGIEKNPLQVFELVDDQSEPLAAARLTEYFIEMGNLESARAAAVPLQRYPADLGVTVARAQLAIALQDADAFAKIFEPLVARVSGGADRNLVWERRVNLAVVLARGNRLDLARAQLQQCLTEANEPRLRTLTPSGLFYLFALNKSLGLQFADPRLQQAGLDLLTPEMRSSL